MSSPEEIAADARKRLNSLQKLNLDLRRQLELAELLIPRVNQTIDQLHTVQFVDNLLFTAGMIFQQPYELGRGPSDSNQIFLAGLKIPGGVGVLMLDSELAWSLEQQNPVNPHWPGWSFTRFEDCADGLKSLILPKLPELFRQFFAALSIGET